MHPFARDRSGNRLITILAWCALMLPPLAAGLSAAQAKTQPSHENGDQTNTQLVAWMSIDGPITEGPSPFAWVSQEDLGLTMRRVLDQLQVVAQTDDYLGVVIRLDQAKLNLSQINELHRGIEKVRESGKKVVVFAEAYDMPTYLLACAADEIVLQRKGMVMLQGMGVEEMYLAGLLEKVGMKADLIQIGEFKGANEALTRKAPSEPWNQNFDALLDSIYDQMLSTIEQGRGLTRWQVEAILADTWTMTDQDYVERRVVDKLSDRDLTEVTSKLFGDHFAWRDLLDSKTSARIESPFALFSLLFAEKKPRTVKPSIAVVHATGPIYSGKSSSGGIFGGESTIGSRTMIETLRDAGADKMIKGVVLRINSPGGSALASEMIWQAVSEVAKKKPVYVSVGSMAASGGYYIACAADEIYVEPSSIVGSIGVVGGKISMGGLYDWLGVSIHRRVRGPLGDIFNSVEPFTPRQREIIKTSMRNMYKQFTDRVRSGRGKRIDDIDAVARGRLFIGKQAVKNGLSDEIGGVRVAVAHLADTLDLKPGEYDTVDLPHAKTLPEVLEDMFGGAETRVKLTGLSREIELARTVLGEARWRAIQPVLAGLMLLQREPVLTLLPAAIVVR